MHVEELESLIIRAAMNPETAALVDARREGEDIHLGLSITADSPPDAPYFRPGDPIPEARPIARVVDGAVIRMGPK